MQLQETLQSKMILCTGPSFGRNEMLKTVTERDQGIIPFKKIFLATNDPANLDIMFGDKKPVVELLEQRGKQLDCINCIIRSIHNVVSDPECADDDIILFKHESVYISDMHLVQKAVGKIIDGYDCVIKYWLGFPHTEIPGRLNDYYHSDSFYMRVGAARPIFKDHPPLTAFTPEYQFCEEYLTKYLIRRIEKIYRLDYHHSSWKDNELGLFHIPRYEDPPEWLWDKKNYHELYA
jgi:hypothetical protein